MEKPTAGYPEVPRTEEDVEAPAASSDTSHGPIGPGQPQYPTGYYPPTATAQSQQRPQPQAAHSYPPGQTASSPLPYSKEAAAAAAAASQYPAGDPGGYPPLSPEGAYGVPSPGSTPGMPYWPPPPPPPLPQEGQQQQQQQGWQGPQPVLGVPVLGEHAAYISQHPVWGPDNHTRDSRFAVCAWVTFALGFFMPFFWLISVLLPCCLPGRHVRRAALCSFLAALTYAVLVVLLATLMSRRHGGSGMRSGHMMMMMM